MNDIGYIKIDYENSVVWNCDRTTHNKEELRRRLLCAEGAIDFHIRDNNPNQIVFFTKQKEFLNKKLKASNEQIH